ARPQCSGPTSIVPRRSSRPEDVVDGQLEVGESERCDSFAASPYKDGRVFSALRRVAVYVDCFAAEVGHPDLRYPVTGVEWDLGLQVEGQRRVGDLDQEQYIRRCWMLPAGVAAGAKDHNVGHGPGVGGEGQRML